MNAKHTPGPWKVFNGVDIYPNNDDKAARHHIADCNPDGWNEALTDIATKEAEANARLIAAAPDLLEACKAALSRRDNYSYDRNENDRAEAKLDAMLEAAIAKAEQTETVPS